MSQRMSDLDMQLAPTLALPRKRGKVGIGAKGVPVEDRRWILAHTEPRSSVHRCSAEKSNRLGARRDVQSSAVSQPIALDGFNHGGRG